MNRALVRALTAVAICALAACSGGSLHQSLIPQQGTPTSQSGAGASGALPGFDGSFGGASAVRAFCPPSLDPERMACKALARNDLMPKIDTFAPDVNTEGEKCPFEGQAYCPNDLQDAYNLPSLRKGKGGVIAIVDAFGYRDAASNLATYRKTMGLKACTTSSKCLRILNQNGGTSPLPKEPPPYDDWRGEQSLDLDMVSAICPNCRIVLIQTTNDLTNNLYTGVKTAGRFSHYIGASWGGPEDGGNNPIFHQTGHVISVSAGDEGGGGIYGGGPEQPCTYTYVVCVGGTRLVRAQNSRGWSETVWNDLALGGCGSTNCGATGSGCSTKIAKPSWQTDGQCHMRSEADVSASAALSAPVAVYNSEIGCKPPNCWFLFGGTSASAQIISAVFALAGNAAGTNGASGIWKHHADLNDVKKGNNVDTKIGVFCASKVPYICTARVGFDGPTGWGTPQGLGAF